MRKKIVAGNWKMNLHHQEAKSLLNDLNAKVGQLDEYVDVIIAPPSIYISEFGVSLANSKIGLAAQNCSHESYGAFTGEISASMLKDVGVSYGIVGHSERRLYQNESNELVKAKIIALSANHIIPIICIGENQSERENGSYFEVIKTQLNALVEIENVKQINFVLAYEPVWAIGTGLTATADQAQEVHAYIRSYLQEKIGLLKSESTSILYGGSCKPENASELFACHDIDGGLIGGASLNAESFIRIAQSF